MKRFTSPRLAPQGDAAPRNATQRNNRLKAAHEAKIAQLMAQG